MAEHIPVLLHEAIQALKIKPNGIYVDATLGRAGHSSEILKRLTIGQLYGFDQDEDAIEASKSRLKRISKNYELIHSNFSFLRQELHRRDVHMVDGILMDLGVSSPQFDESGRGFSYRSDARLDMRMDRRQKLTAYDIVNSYGVQSLTRVLRDYGEERFAYEIAKKIVSQRIEAPIATTFQLVEVIKSAIPKKFLSQKGHPAKQTFQALRIATNNELIILEVALQEAMALLAPKGRLVVIAFHSLEDRIVKNAFRKVSQTIGSRRNAPALPYEYEIDYQIINNKVITPGEIELENNPRAAGAKMRILERK